MRPTGWQKFSRKIVTIGDDLLPGETPIRHLLDKLQTTPRKASTIKDDANAGLTVAMNEIPDGMACGLLAGVNPVMGLYAAICGCLVSGIFNSTRLMIVTTTSAAAFMLFHLTRSYPEAQRTDVLIWLVVLSGLMMIIMGMLRLGNMVRFVSFSVMIGFLTGIALLTILSQLPVIFDISVEGPNKVMQTVDLISKIAATNWYALIPALVTIVLMWLLPKTFLGNRAAIVAIALPSLLIYLLKWDAVQLVGDVGQIPDGIPAIRLPGIALIDPSLLLGAFSLALITIIQAAGVSQSVPNPDGSRSDTSRDFISQGAANISSGIFGGIAVGGSLGSTALNILSGARSRWSGIFSGILVLALLILVPDLVEHVAMPVLAGLMIYAMASALKLGESAQVWNAGWASRLGLLTSFFATLLLPIPHAIIIGMLLSFSLYFFASSRAVKLRERRLLDDGRFEEIPRSKEIKSYHVHIFSVDGDLHFAGARIFENQWPKVTGDTSYPAVILDLSGRNNIGATLTEVIELFYRRIKKSGGRFYLTELVNDSYESFRVQADSDVLKGIKIMKRQSMLGESTREAVKEAEDWLKGVSVENDNPGSTT